MNLPLYPPLIKIIRSYGRFYHLRAKSPEVYTFDEQNFPSLYNVFARELFFRCIELQHPETGELILDKNRYIANGTKTKNVFLSPKHAKILNKFNKNLGYISDSSHEMSLAILSGIIKHIYYYFYKDYNKGIHRRSDEYFTIIVELNTRKSRRFLLIHHNGWYGSGYDTEYNKYYLYNSVDELMKNHNNDVIGRDEGILGSLFYKFQDMISGQ